MTAAGIGHDGQQRIAEVRAQDGSGGQVDVSLGHDGVGRAVAFRGVGGAVEEGVDGLVATEIDDAKGLAGFDFVDPGVARRDNFIDDGLVGPQCAFGHR